TRIVSASLCICSLSLPYGRSGRPRTVLGSGEGTSPGIFLSFQGRVVGPSRRDGRLTAFTPEANPTCRNVVPVSLAPVSAGHRRSRCRGRVAGISRSAHRAACLSLPWKSCPHALDLLDSRHCFCRSVDGIPPLLQSDADSCLSFSEQKLSGVTLTG